MKKTIADVKIGDKIKGTDGKWHKVIDKTEVRCPFKMYELTFSNGVIKCSDTHQWNIFVDGKEYTVDTMGLQTNFDFYVGRPIGTPDGPLFIGIKEIEPEPVICLTTSAKDSQFFIYTTKTADFMEQRQKDRETIKDLMKQGGLL